MNPSGNSRKVTKKSEQPQSNQVRQKSLNKPLRPVIQQIYPVEIKNPQLMSPQLKQYINELQKQYIERYNILLANRAKYQQMIENLAINLDQKGVSNHVVAETLRNSTYHYEMD